MANSERAEEDATATDERRSEGSPAQEDGPSPPFEKGWRWPLIIMIVGVIAIGAFVTLVTAANKPPPPPPPPPPAPAPATPSG